MPFNAALRRAGQSWPPHRAEHATPAELPAGLASGGETLHMGFNLAPTHELQLAPVISVCLPADISFARYKTALLQPGNAGKTARCQAAGSPRPAAITVWALTGLEWAPRTAPPRSTSGRDTSPGCPALLSLLQASLAYKRTKQ